MGNGMTQEQKTIRVIDHIISLVRPGEDIFLDLRTVPSVDENDVRKIFKGLSEEFPLSLFVSDGPPGMDILSSTIIKNVTIHHPDVELLEQMKASVCHKNVGDFASEVIGATPQTTVQPPTNKAMTKPKSNNRSHCPITKIAVVRPKDKDCKNIFKVVVNKDYSHPIEGDKAMKCWVLLYTVAVDKVATDDGRKSELDYLNTNKACKLYTATGCKPTKILRQASGHIKTEENVTIELITERAFKRRQKKQGTEP